MTELRKAIGDAIKALEGNRVGGYLVRFTNADDRDLHNEYFTKDTNFWLKEHPIIGKPILIDHAFDDHFKSVPVGIIDFLKEDEIGLWIEGKLKERAEYEDMLRGWKERKWLGDNELPNEKITMLAGNLEKAVKSFFATNKAQWSSGALPQSVEIADDGHIKSWAIIEGTGVHTPAEPDGTQITLKGIIQSLSLPSVPDTSIDAQHKETIADNGLETTPIKTISIKGTKMNPELLKELIAMLQAMLAEQGLPEGEAMAMADEVAEEMKAETPEEEELKAAAPDEELVKAWMQTAIAKAQTKAAKRLNVLSAAKQMAVSAANNYKANAPVSEEAAKGLPKFTGGNGAKGHISVSAPNRFPHWEAEDFTFALMLDKQIRAKGKQGILNAQDENEFLREYADKAQKAIASNRMAGTKAATKAFNAIKANELSQSTLANYGDEWVPDLWDSTLWMKARIDTVGLPQFRVVDMPSNPFELPIEGTDATMYYVAETSGEAQLTLAASDSPIPDSKIGSGKVQLSAKKFGVRVGFSAELEEDSIIPVLSIYRQQAETGFMEGIDDVIFNGDTETGTTNINSDGSALGATSRFLALNGLRKDTFTNSANQIDALGASPTLAMIRRARFLLGRTVSGKIPGLRIFVNPETEGKLLGLDEFITMDKAGNGATAQTGQIGFIDRIPVLVTDQMPLTDADGKVTAAGNSVSRGTLVMAYAPHWVVGFRRRLSNSLDFLPYYDSYQLTMTARMDFKPRDTDSAVAIINLGIG